MSTQQIPISSIQSTDRIRRDDGDLASLCEAMHEKGLLQGIGVQHRNGEYKLLWGHRRLQAAIRLGWESIEAKIAPDLQDYEASELEFMENWERKSMTWQEEALGLLRIHTQRVRKGILNKDAWGQRETGRLLGIALGNVNYTLKVAKLLEENDREVHECYNMADALRLLLRRKDAEIMKEGGTPTPRKPEEMFFKKEDIDHLHGGGQGHPQPPPDQEYELCLVPDPIDFNVVGAGIVGYAIESYEEAPWILERSSDIGTGMKQSRLEGGIVFRDLSRNAGTPFIEGQIVPFQFYYDPEAVFEVCNIPPYYADNPIIDRMLFGQHAVGSGFWRWFFETVKGSYTSVFWARPRSIDGVCFSLRNHMTTYATLTDPQLEAVKKEMSKYGSLTCINFNL